MSWRDEAIPEEATTVVQGGWQSMAVPEENVAVIDRPVPTFDEREAGLYKPKKLISPLQRYGKQQDVAAQKALESESQEQIARDKKIRQQQRINERINEQQQYGKDVWLRGLASKDASGKYVNWQKRLDDLPAEWKKQFPDVPVPKDLGDEYRSWATAYTQAPMFLEPEARMLGVQGAIAKGLPEKYVPHMQAALQELSSKEKPSGTIAKHWKAFMEGGVPEGAINLFNSMYGGGDTTEDRLKTQKLRGAVVDPGEYGPFDPRKYTLAAAGAAVPMVQAGAGQALTGSPLLGTIGALGANSHEKNFLQAKESGMSDRAAHLTAALATAVEMFFYSGVVREIAPKYGGAQAMADRAKTAFGEEIFQHAVKGGLAGAKATGSSQAIQQIAKKVTGNGPADDQKIVQDALSGFIDNAVISALFTAPKAALEAWAKAHPQETKQLTEKETAPGRKDMESIGITGTNTEDRKTFQEALKQAAAPGTEQQPAQPPVVPQQPQPQGEPSNEVDIVKDGDKYVLRYPDGKVAARGRLTSIRDKAKAMTPAEHAATVDAQKYIAGKKPIPQAKEITPELEVIFGLNEPQEPAPQEPAKPPEQPEPTKPEPTRLESAKAALSEYEKKFGYDKILEGRQKGSMRKANVALKKQRDASEEYQRLKAEVKKADAAEKAAGTKEVKNELREQGKQDAAAGEISREAMKYAPLHTLPDEVRSMIQEGAEWLVDEYPPDSATGIAARKIIEDAGKDTGAAVEDLKERIVEKKAGERGGRNFTDQPWPVDPLADLYDPSNKKEHRVESLQAALDSVAAGKPNPLAARIGDFINRESGVPFHADEEVAEYLRGMLKREGIEPQEQEPQTPTQTQPAEEPFQLERAPAKVHQPWEGSVPEDRTQKTMFATGGLPGQQDLFSTEGSQREPAEKSEPAPPVVPPEDATSGEPRPQGSLIAPGSHGIIDSLRKQIGNLIRTWRAKRQVAREYDVSENVPAIEAHRIRNDVAEEFQHVMGRKINNRDSNFLPFLVEGGGSKERLLGFQKTLAGLATKGKPWVKTAQQSVDYVLANMDRLENLRVKIQAILEDRVYTEQSKGFDVEHRQAYFPHDQELIDELPTLFGKKGGAGGSSAPKHQRVYDSFADSIAAGVKPKTLNGLDLLEARIRKGIRWETQQEWAEAGRNIFDQTTGKPIVTDPIVKYKTWPDGSVHVSDVTAPKDYVLMQIGGRKPTAVYKEYEGIYQALTGVSSLRNSALGRGIMALASFEKAGLTLFDSFHPMRILFYDSVLHPVKTLTGQASYKRGLLLLDHNDETLTRMAARGEIPEKLLPELLKERAVTELYIRRGLNVGNIADNITKDMLHNMPVLGAWNHWVFGELQRGAVMRSAIIEHARMSRALPELTEEQVSDKVIKDLNTRFGNLKRQGWFKSRTFQDISRLVLLAPEWVQGLVRSEIGTVRDLATETIPMALRGRLVASSLVKGNAVGLLAYFAANQIINYITRGKPTWENEEEGFSSKISAWIPDLIGNGPGVFLNPMSLFTEISSQFLHLLERRGNLTEAAIDVASNKAAPIPRAAYAWVKEAAKTHDSYQAALAGGKALIPLPIPTRPVLAAGRTLTGQKTTEDYPGEMERQLLSSLGVRTESVPSSEQRIYSLVDKFKQNYVSETGKTIQPRPEFTGSDYAELVRALRQDDPQRAKQAIADLSKTKEPAVIEKYFKNWPNHPFTGSKELEEQFVKTLNPEQKKQYDAAREQRKKMAEKFFNEYVGAKKSDGGLPDERKTTKKGLRKPAKLPFTYR